MDAPDGACDLEDGLWEVYLNTLLAGGFGRVESMRARLDLSAPEIEARIQALAESTNDLRLEGEDPGGETSVEGIAEVFRSLLRRFAPQMEQGFIVAFHERFPLRSTWRNMGLTHHVFGPAHVPLALHPGCLRPIDSDSVNSIFRPTLPPLRLANVENP